MHAFIVRPFGTKNGINFDNVEAKLIRPALRDSGFSGGTTAEFIEQGNIRADMFEQLLTSDLVIADISIHNANVFYELGIRHALRDKQTFLIKSSGDNVPFDLKTDRYMPYNAEKPAESLPGLTAALKRTWELHPKDSPVYQLLPDLESVDPKKFLVVPLDFREEVEQAQNRKRCGDLQLLVSEIDGFAWKSMGLRMIGRAQFELKDWQAAKTTWKAVRNYDAMDLEANTKLGTIYQRLGDLTASDQALERALQNKIDLNWDRAEILALLARNAKTLLYQELRGIQSLDKLQKAALSSPQHEKSMELYHKGFIEDRNHFYSGLNALAMVTMTLELAAAQPDAWEDGFETKIKADYRLNELKELRFDLTAGVKLAIKSRHLILERQQKSDIWTDISAADLSLLSSTKPKYVGRAYNKALANAPEFARESVFNQLYLYRSLGILNENIQEALSNIPEVEHHEERFEAPPHVILFTGHRIDVKDREKPRFPQDKEDQAREMILEAVTMVKGKVNGKLLGISGGACGGDILFHEVCDELEIPTKMYLTLSKQDYIKASVADGGPDWVVRFKHLFNIKHPLILSESGELPTWLNSKSDYNIWQRTNLWMLHNALDISKDNLTLVALWNGEVGDGPGGTDDLVQRAQNRGATFIHLDARKLID